MQPDLYLGHHPTVVAHLRRARWDMKRVMRTVERRVASRTSRAPAFVVGCGRSGTTLLARVLGRHPEIVSLNEPRDRWAVVDPRTDDIALYGRGGTLDLGQDDVTDWARRARHLISNPFGHPRDSKVIEKTPTNVFRLRWLRALYPACPLINIIRDGRDVVASIVRLATTNEHKIAPAARRNQWWGLGNCKLDLVLERAVRVGLLPAIPQGLEGESKDATAAALEWVMSIDTAFDFAASGEGQDMLEVRYESLVADPEREVSRILAFLGARTGVGRETCSIVETPVRACRPCDGSDRVVDSIHPTVLPLFMERLESLGYRAADTLALSR